MVSYGVRVSLAIAKHRVFGRRQAVLLEMKVLEGVDAKVTVSKFVKGLVSVVHSTKNGKKLAGKDNVHYNDKSSKITLADEKREI